MTMNPYEQKRADRIDRLRERSARLDREAESTHSRAEQMAAVIPFGQPIASNSQRGRDIRYRQRIRDTFDKSYELSKEAREVARRAQSAESNTAVSSDDPDAVEKLREKLAASERAVVATKEANKLLRAAGDNVTGHVIAKVAELLGWAPERAASTLGILRSMGQPTFSTTNVAAEARRLKKRIAEIEAKTSAPDKPAEVIGEVRIEEADNRVRVFFPGKPPEHVRSALKGAGFRWAPSEGAWQRHASNGAWYEANRIATAHTLSGVTMAGEPAPSGVPSGGSDHGSQEESKSA